MCIMRKYLQEDIKTSVLASSVSACVVGLDTAECYDVRCGEWRMISPMSTRRSSVGVGVVNGK